jgi:hypothetical protein
MSDRDWFKFEVEPTEHTRIETEGNVLAWGVQFPSGWCYVDWNRDVFDAKDRLDHPHVSIYGSIDDVEQGTGGRVRRLD